MVRKSIMIAILTAALLYVLFTWMEWDVQKGRKANATAHPLYISPVYDGEIQLIADGNSFYNTLFHDIENAKNFIHIHFFLVRNDKVSKAFFQSLIKKADQGVDVKLSVDLLGSFQVTRDTIQELKKHGIQFTYSRRAKLAHPLYTFNRRNHRRLAVIDGLIAYTGGYNVGKEYIGQAKRFGPWRDYHIRITGNGVSEAEKQFIRDWEEDTGTVLKQQNTISTMVGKSKYQYIFSSGNGLEEKVIEWIRSANQSIMIATPYFLPSEPIVQELEHALERKVHVTFIITGRTDAWFTQPPGYPGLETLFKKGATIFQYKQGLFHGKVFIVDNKMADIGTLNWDQRSFFINDESNCLIYDQAFIAKVRENLQKDMENSMRLTDSFFQHLPIWVQFFKHTPQRIQFFL